MEPAGAALWLTHIDDVGAGALRDYRGWLGESEAARFERFARPSRQRQFLLGRGLLRRALGELLAVTPKSIRLTERRGGAPRLDAAGAASFSIAHSGPWVACAVSTDAALGLDIEMRDGARDLLALAAVAFDSAAVAALAALNPDERADDFYRRWCEQEARVKLGAGAEPACIAVPHAELAIVVCAARPLALAVHTLAAH